MKHYLFIGFLSLTVLAGGLSLRLEEGEVMGVLAEPEGRGVVAFQNTPITESFFSIDTETEVVNLPFAIEYQDTDELELGQFETTQKGQNGWITRQYQLIYWENQLQSREVVSEERQEPVSEIVLRGTKIVAKILQTPEGQFTYYLKKEVYATSYDGDCIGCRGLTYLGTPVKKGVCAVDRSEIPLGTLMYVNGYGLCRAEDIGGSIKGDRIDLGFEDVENGFWSARWTMIYLLME